jgi:glycosyltransferase involved in cell wall biosynthesis
MTSPSVSVIIPTRNRWQLLSRTLQSALSQEGVAVELVVVDDGSDRRDPLASGLEDSRVRLVRHEHRQGAAGARNTGIRIASAPWVAFLDDDDFWAPHRLRVLLDALARARGSFAYCAALVVDDRLRPRILQPAPPGNQLMRALLRSNAIPGGASNVVARTSLLRKLGGFDESMSFLADWDMWIRMAELGGAVAVPEVLIAYLHHPGNWVLREDSAISEDLQRLIEKHAEPSKRHGVSVDVLEYDRYIAHRLWLAGRQGASVRRYLAAGWKHRDPGSFVRAGRALMTAEFASRVGLARQWPQAPEWLEKYALGHSTAVPTT